MLSATVLLGFAGLAVDAGTLFREKRLVQTAADSAAIAGASQTKYGTVTASARADAALNGFTNGSNGASVIVNNPPLSGPHTGASNTNYVEVIVSQSSPTFFMRAFGRSSMTVAARAVAALGNGQNCIIALNSNQSGALLINGTNSYLNAPNCGVAVDSNSGSAINVNGNPSPAITAGSISVVGGASGPSGAFSPTPSAGAAPVSDPLAYLSAPSAAQCGSTMAKNVGTTASPGNYSSGMKITGGATLSAGLYCVGGALDISGNGTVDGTSGVTFYIASGGSVKISGSATLNLDAPSPTSTTAAYPGILFYMDSAGTMDITGSSLGTFEGTLYAPTGKVKFGGGTGVTFDVNIVADTIELAGNPTVNNYDSVVSKSLITATALVE